jgi:hypothetical protein
MLETVQTVTNWQIYQPLIVGLGAVVVGTLGNTLIEWYKQHLTRTHAARGLRRALAAELKLEKETADEATSRYGNPEEGGSFIIPIQERHSIYDGAVGQLGLLQPKQIEAVVYAYAMLKARVETIVVIGGLHRIEGTILQGRVDAKWGEMLASQTKDLSAALDVAIKELEN